MMHRPMCLTLGVSGELMKFIYMITGENCELSILNKLITVATSTSEQPQTSTEPVAG